MAAAEPPRGRHAKPEPAVAPAPVEMRVASVRPVTRSVPERARSSASGEPWTREETVGAAALVLLVLVLGVSVVFALVWWLGPQL